jgi:hypothetical protein
MLVLLGAGAWASGIGGVGGGAALAIVGGPLLLGGVLYLVSAFAAGRARPVGETPGGQSEAR